MSKSKRVPNWLICYHKGHGDIYWDNIQALSAMQAIEILGLKDHQVINVYREYPRWRNSRSAVEKSSLNL